jgi:type II restriction enzyme
MADDTVTRLLDSLKLLRPDQLERVEAFVRALNEPPVCTFRGSGFATESFAHRFADVLRFHHQFSAEPFTKDKFEHAMEGTLKQTGHKAELAPRGNPGHDLTADGERWSLKTQADRAIKSHTLHISKFMELGKGRWETEADLIGLREQFLGHMDSYDRIFSLRCFRTAMQDGTRQYQYELVEIPKALLLQAKAGQLKLMHDSPQNPKPGYCNVAGERGVLLFRLYFDGGTERKLQIRDLAHVCGVLGRPGL